MTVDLVKRTPVAGMAADFAAPGPPGVVSLWWLGQAGFLLRHASLRIAIDPYLSDSLAEKYRGTPFPHLRMMPPPVLPHELATLDVVLCSHGHTDHMDPGTLPGIAAASPACRFIVPEAERDKALARGVPPGRLIGVDAGDSLSLGDGSSLMVLPAAHEELKFDGQGKNFFLGFALRLGGTAIYHSGDCVPFDGLEARLREQKIDVALLPVNGRDTRRAASGVPGNFRLSEALALCGSAGIPRLFGHHYGMFDFNTIDVAAAEAEIRRSPLDVRAELAAPAMRYDFVHRL